MKSNAIFCRVNPSATPLLLTVKVISPEAVEAIIAEISTDIKECWLTSLVNFWRPFTCLCLFSLNQTLIHFPSSNLSSSS